MQTFCRKSLLSAYNGCLLHSEMIITDSAPSVIEADLHSTVSPIWCSPSYQSDLSILTHLWRTICC